MLQDPSKLPKQPQNEDSDSGDDLMCLSSYAMNGRGTLKTIRIVGNLLSHKPLILVDSGSSSNFISEQLASQLPGWIELLTPVQVKIADGKVM